MKNILFLCSVLICVVCIRQSTTMLPGCLGVASIPNPNPGGFKVKAVNLGGWLVTEGWIKPSLFDAIPNKDLLDGTQVQLKSVSLGKYLCSENGGGSILVANRLSASGWETFKLWRINENTFNLRVFNNQFVGLQTEGAVTALIATANEPAASEVFQLFRKTDDPYRIRIRASNGLYLQAKTQDLLTADYAADEGWGGDDPSIFLMTIVATLRGEFQVTNGYGPDRALLVMKEHWSTFIVEDDFKFISESGINAVRIPVGWWIASDPPPAPFVGGSLQALDNAFSWSQKHNIQVILDLHAAPGSQNGNEHSGTRDGSLEWGISEDTIQKTVAVINFLAARYSNHPNLYAVELINEPQAFGVSLDSLIKYYRLGYDAVRNQTSKAFVIMSNRLGDSVDPRELFPVTSELRGVVIDVHYYNLFSEMFNNLNAQENINFVNKNRSTDLSYITTANGPLTFVGEWVAEWNVRSATNHDLQMFAAVQLQVYRRASFGWAYWTFKNVNNHWSLQWMIKNGYINLN